MPEDPEDDTSHKGDRLWRFFNDPRSAPRSSERVTQGILRRSSMVWNCSGSKLCGVILPVIEGDILIGVDEQGFEGLRVKMAQVTITAGTALDD